MYTYVEMKIAMCKPAKFLFSPDVKAMSINWTTTSLWVGDVSGPKLYVWFQRWFVGLHIRVHDAYVEQAVLPDSAANHTRYPYKMLRPRQGQRIRQSLTFPGMVSSFHLCFALWLLPISLSEDWPAMKSNSVTYSSLGAARCIALATCLAGALAYSNGSVDPISLTISSEGGNKSSPLLYGIMFEVSTARLLRSMTVSLTFRLSRKWTILVWNPHWVSPQALLTD